ncbi:bifunctional diguanylate cyclase/phosphodiesterase [Massilia niastensis]|uniref:bifunctional diguanylate cyclase/phosphodiesterase n=1 Tax=Massilia niastensis TaxID=544911 RepID=UPI001E297503|nr:EAL domain-containing protein [Massilia niastensis]
MRHIETQRMSAEFNQRSGMRVAAVTRAFNDATGAVRAVNLLFQASTEVSHEDFDTFTQPLVRQHGYLQALVFQRMVTAPERAAFEADRARTWPGFEIKQRGPGGLVRAGDRLRYLVNDFVVPIVGNEIAYGYDSLSNPDQRAYILRAIDTGEPTSSPLIDLLQGDGTRRGVVIVQPVYRTGASLVDVAARRRSVIGSTEVVIDVALLVGGSLQNVRLLDDKSFGLTLSGQRTDGAVVPVYQAGNFAGERTWLHETVFGAPLRYVESFTVAGKQWEVEVQQEAYGIVRSLAELAVFALGVVLSFSIAGLVQQRSVRTRRIEALVEQRTAALEQASSALRLFERAIEASANPILIINALRPHYPIEYVNPACERTYGYKEEELAGRPLETFADEEANQPALQELRGALRERREGHAMLRQFTREGAELMCDIYIAPVRRADGVTEHFVVSIYDITTAKHYEAELEHRAQYDTLTGLANRVLLADRLERAIAIARENPVWAVSLDLDHFKLINDTLGRREGDRALCEIASRIARTMRQTDTAARVGGDNFMLVLCGCTDERQAAARLQEVREAVSEPLALDKQVLVMTCTAGIAGYPVDGADAETLVKHSEIAMYRAKEIGRNGLQFYAPHMNAHATDRLALEGALRHALRDDQFELYFQPQIDLASGFVVGTEALIRWRHPQLGTVRPDRFIALAEETGLIVPIGAWALRTACRQNERWRHDGVGPLRVAVNLSARQFAEPDLVETVARALHDTGLPADMLEIELTESMMMADVEAAIETMRCLKRMGVKLSIDDFGTGYSSLSYLKRLPVDVLKIDRSFVHDIVSSADSAAMVDAIISLAHGLRMQVIAEGVETLEQLDYLRNCGCDEVQGHIFSQPQPVAIVEALLRAGRFQPAPVDV